MRRVPSLVTTALALLSSGGCVTVIKDATFCSPLPGGQGAACDSLLTHHQQILSAEEWAALQTSWNNLGSAIECTNSETVGDLKEEIELLCSHAKCDYAPAPSPSPVETE